MKTNIASVLLILAIVAGGLYWKLYGNRPVKSAEQIEYDRKVAECERTLLKKNAHMSLAEARKQAKLEAHRAIREKKRRNRAQTQAQPKQLSIVDAARIFDREEQRHLNEDEKKFLDELNEAMLDDDVEIVGEVANEMANNPNPVMRRNAVEAISWFGDEGLPELAQYMTDPDSTVAELARERWSIGISELESDKEKVALSKLAILSVDDEDAISDYMSDLSMANDDLEIMQALVDIIEEGSPLAAKAAKEQYESMTTDEWRGFDYAEAWLKENYDPPDPEENPEEPVEHQENPEAESSETD